jgi:hypothetical protein
MGVSRQGAFSHLLQPVLKEVFFNRYSQFPDEYTQWINVETTDRAYEEDLEVAGFGKFVQKQEGRAISYDDPFQGGLVRYTPTPWALGFRVTYELYKNDQHNIIKRMPNALARSAHQTIEVQAHSVLNYAFTASVQGRDGVCLCSTAHPNIRKQVGSGPYSNRLSTDSDLSITSLQSAFELMENTTDDRDLNIMLRPKLLICAVENQWTAEEILKSEKKPYVGDNETNVMRGRCEYFVSHYLTDTDAWFLLCDKADHYLKFYWREKLRMDNDDDFNTMDALYRGFMWFTQGFSGWRGIVGTPGA